MLYLKLDVLQLADVIENFVEKSTLEYSINPFLSLLSTWLYMESWFEDDQNQIRFHKRKTLTTTT